MNMIRPIAERSMGFLNSTEFMSRDGAHRLAQQIEAYWRKKGKTVKTRLEMAGGTFDRKMLYCVRSDMRGGQPR